MVDPTHNMSPGTDADVERAAAERPTDGNGRDRERAELERLQRAESRPGAEGMSVPALLRRLVDDAATLFRKELAMATSEILHSVHDVRSGIASTVSGAAITYAGFLFLLVAATLGLAQVFEDWLAALIVGGAVLIVGFIMMQAGKSKTRARHFAPDRTAEALRKDHEMIGRQIR